MIFINDITDNINDSVTTLFADDVALLSQGTTIEEAEKRTQISLDTIVKWAEKWKMVISKEKTVCLLISTRSNESTYVPRITLQGSNVNYDPHPVFLGVTFDWGLFFHHQAKIILPKMKQRINIIRGLAGRTWGYHPNQLRSLYLTYVRSKCEYAAAGWSQCASSTSIELLEKVQQAAARIITGCVKSTPKDALLKEANLTPIDTRFKILSTVAREKFLRLPDSNPIYHLTKNTTQYRIKTRRSWNLTAYNVSQQLNIELYKRAPIMMTSSTPPWVTNNNVKFNATIADGVNKSNTTDEQKQAALKYINSLPEAQVICWTDGSVLENNENGGSGIYVESNIIPNKKLSFAAGAFSSSYSAESNAVVKCLQHIINQAYTFSFITGKDGLSHVNEIRICTDSQSLVSRLSRGPTSQKDTVGNEIWKHLNFLTITRRKHITFQWIPGHCDLEGNEEADKLAKTGTTLSQDIAS